MAAVVAVRITEEILRRLAEEVARADLTITDAVTICALLDIPLSRVIADATERINA